MQLKRTWAEIDLTNLAHNFALVKKNTADDVNVLSVIKANAYGHGAKQTAKKLEECGTDWFGVSNINEGIELRRAGITKPVLILGFTPPDMAASLYENRLTQALLNYEYALSLGAFAVEAGVTVDCHVKLDTGMSRIGFNCDDPTAAAGLVVDVCRMKGLNVNGIFTHFAVADEETQTSREFTEFQASRFDKVIKVAEQLGARFEFKHCCNSAGTLFYKQYHYNMVRPGIMLYGCSPTGFTIPDLPLKPVMSLKTIVVQIKNIKPGDTVGYGREFTADREMTVATVPIGYADGYFRRMSSCGVMWLRGELVPVLGRVCMDQLMLDVTGIPACCGDEVTVFGGDSPISADNIAGLSETCSYEWLCDISRRVPRVYLENGEVVLYEDYLG